MQTRRHGGVPPGGLGGLGATVLGLGGVLGVILALVSAFDPDGFSWPIALASAAAFVATDALFRERPWGSIAAAAVLVPAAVLLFISDWVVAAGVALALATALQAGWLRLLYRRVRAGGPIDFRETEERVPEPTRFVSHGSIVAWVVVALVGIVFAIVLPWLSR